MRVFEKWDLHAEAIGTVTADRRAPCPSTREKLEADVPNEALTDKAPLYDRPWVDAHEPRGGRRRLSRSSLPKTLGRHGSSSSLRPPSPASAGSIGSTTRRFEVEHAGGPRLRRRSRSREGHLQGPGHEDRRQRTLWMARPLRGRPAGRGRGLPQRRGLGSDPPGRDQLPQLRQTPSGPRSWASSSWPSGAWATPCRAFGVPITGGNVSLYNETDGAAIYPTVVIGVVGLLEDASKVLTACFKDEGDVVYLLGETREDLGGSEFLKVVHGKVAGRPPHLDVEVRDGGSTISSSTRPAAVASPLGPRLQRRRPGRGPRRVRLPGRGAGPRGALRPSGPAPPGRAAVLRVALAHDRHHPRRGTVAGGGAPPRRALRAPRGRGRRSGGLALGHACAGRSGSRAAPSRLHEPGVDARVSEGMAQAVKRAPPDRRGRARAPGRPLRLRRLARAARRRYARVPAELFSRRRGRAWAPTSRCRRCRSRSSTGFRLARREDQESRPGSRADLLTADSIALGYDPWPLLRGRLQIDELSVDAPVIRIVSDPRGSYNYERLKVYEASSSSKAASLRPGLPRASLHVSSW